MRLSFHRRATRIRTLAASAMLCCSIAAPTQSLAMSPGYGAAEIETVLRNPQVIQFVSDWGMSMQDVRHDVNAMPPQERIRLAFALARRWNASPGQSQAALQAQFLVMMSLMRESTLFASVLSTGNSRFLR